MFWLKFRPIVTCTGAVEAPLSIGTHAPFAREYVVTIPLMRVIRREPAVPVVAAADLKLGSIQEATSSDPSGELMRSTMPGLLSRASATHALERIGHVRRV